MSSKRERGAKLDTDLSAEDLRAVADRFLAIVAERTGADFPTDPSRQLELAIRAVFDSWFGKRAHDYREFNKIPHDLGTAVNIVTMVFGNMGADSGTGVAFTRDPNTGARELYGEYLTNAQGEDVVAGVRTPAKISQMRDELPAVYREFEEIAERLERHYRDVQDLEFTIERGKLYMLQTRSAKRTAPAAVKIAVDMVGEGILTREEALGRVGPAQIVQLLLPRFDESAKGRAADRFLAKGLNASPGAATGQAIFDPDRAEEAKAAGHPVILVRIETSPDDVHGMLAARGVLTARGGATSHAAVVARSMGLPCVAGAESLQIDYAARTMQAGGVTVREGEMISIDGTTGEIYAGELPTIEARYEDEHDLATLLGLGRCCSAPAGLGQRRLSARCGARPGLRGAGDRPVPHRAHVLRGGAAADRAPHDPGRHARHGRQAPPRGWPRDLRRRRRDGGDLRRRARGAPDAPDR